MTKYYIITLICICLFSCNESRWLDIKPNKSDIVPSTLDDYAALLNDDAQLNDGEPNLGILSSDNYYVTDAVFQSASEYDRNSYIWASDIYEGLPSWDWNMAYKSVGITNIVLDGIERLPSRNEKYNRIKGTALFFRGLNLFNLVQQFAKPYNSGTANSDLGIPLKLSVEVDEKIERNTVEETYLQILQDLEMAVELLPTDILNYTNPSKVAAMALIGKVHFYMENYSKALEYISDVLSTRNELLDFNLVDPSISFPFPNLQSGHVEVLFYSTTNFRSFLSNSRLLIHDEFYNLYDDDDLRKVLFFNSTNRDAIQFRGYYTGVNSSHFAGIATNELYLTAAECNVRLGNPEQAVWLLNELLKNRYKSGTFSGYSFNSDEEVLRKILLERNKELPFTGIVRWMDLRRLNRDPRFAVELTRTVLGTVYTLPPNDRRYVLPLPDSEIIINGIEQNER